MYEPIIYNFFSFDSFGWKYTASFETFLSFNSVTSAVIAYVSVFKPTFHVLGNSSY